MKNLTIEMDWHIAIILAIIAIILTMIITYGIFLSSTYVIRVLGEKGMDAFTRVMGLLTVAIAIQFMFLAIEGWLLEQGLLI
jgi:multiple antibiotic resistance protein